MLHELAIEIRDLGKQVITIKMRDFVTDYYDKDKWPRLADYYCKDEWSTLAGYYCKYECSMLVGYFYKNEWSTLAGTRWLRTSLSFV